MKTKRSPATAQPDTPAADDTSADRRVPTAQRVSRPRLPHERDAAADSQTPVPGPVHEIGEQAHEDLARGLEDTDRGPVIDEVYRKSVKPPAPHKPPRR